MRFSGLLLNEVRKSCEMSCRELSDRSKLPYSVVARYLSTHAPRTPRQSTLESILEVLNEARTARQLSTIDKSDVYIMDGLSVD